MYCHAVANVCGEKAEAVRAASDSSLNVMDSTPLPCDVHAHLMLKWPIHGTIVFQSCQGKVQNRADFLLPGVITMPQFTAQSIQHCCLLHKNVSDPSPCCLKTPNLICFKDATMINPLYHSSVVLQTGFH